MPKAHRQDDLRACGARTVVTGQSSVTIDGKLWAVYFDPNTHGAGELINTFNSVTINGKKVIVNTPDKANMDNLGHAYDEDETASASASVSCYG